MAEQLICLDTSVLIDYYRKKDKSKSLLFNLTKVYSCFSVTAITEYELYLGNSEIQNIFWDNFFSQITVLPFDTIAARNAVEIYKQLKSKNKMIDTPDILIAGTVMRYNYSLVTLNRKHFERIDGLQIVTDKLFISPYKQN